MAIINHTDLLATKADLKSALVQTELKASAKVMPFITDVSMFAKKGAKSISFPRAGSFTVENRATGVAGTNQTVAFGEDILNLDIRAHVQWAADANDEYQSTVDVEAEYIKRAVSAHARDFDSRILAGIKAAAGFTGGGTLTIAEILNMREYILKNNGSVDNMVLMISVAKEKAMLAINDFVQSQTYGSPNTALKTGVIGTVYGVQVVVNNLLADADALMWDKSGYCFGLQKAPNYASQDNIEYGSTAKLHVVDQLYGHKLLQEGELSAGAGNSPLIASLA